jgi:DnaJ like chaperone protein
LSLLALSAAVMKADGKILKSELEVVKQFLVRNFGEDEAREQLQMLKSLLEQDIPLNDICFQIKFHMNYSQRLMLLQMLFGISAADGDLHRAEIDLIAKISYWLDISGADYDSVKTMFSGIKQNKADWYQILEIDENASDEEVKKAYRKMAMKHHPDKVSTLGPEIQQAAQEKFRKIQEAYEAIKKDRNLK